MGAPIEVFEALALLKLGVERVGIDVEEVHERHESADPVDGGEEDQRPARMPQKEVIKIDILNGSISYVDLPDSSCANASVPYLPRGTRFYSPSGWPRCLVPGSSQ